MSLQQGITTTPSKFGFWCPENEGKQPPLSEDLILKRLEQARKLLRLPPSVWEVIVEVVAPDPGDDLDDGADKPLPEPTRALPGTEEKAEVLADRARAGEQLWHPDDATWDDPEDAHTEQVGQSLRNGAIKRTKCKVAHRDGASIVVPRDPEEAVDTLRRSFSFGELRELAGLLWEGVGYQPKKHRSPAEGFLVIAEQIKPRRRKRGKKKRRGEVPGQMLLWSEPETAQEPTTGEVAA